MIISLIKGGAKTIAYLKDVQNQLLIQGMCGTVGSANIYINSLLS